MGNATVLACAVKQQVQKNVDSYILCFLILLHTNTLYAVGPSYAFEEDEPFANKLL